MAAKSVLIGDPLVLRITKLGERNLELACLAFQQLAANLNRAFALVLVQPVLDLVAGAGALGKAQPVATWRVSGLRCDLDDVAVAQTRSQRHNPAVHLRPGRGVAHLGMNGVRKVDGTCILRQNNNLALRRKGVHLFGVKIDLERRHELVRIAHLTLPLHQLPHPRQPLFILGGYIIRSLVLPMRRNAFFGDSVHVFRANLHLELVSALRDQRRVQRLIEIWPRHRDKVLDTPRHWPPDTVQQAQHGVAILDTLTDHANGQQVIHLVDWNLLALELLLNRVQPLDPRLHTPEDPMLPQLLFHLRDHLHQEGLVLTAERIHLV